MTAHTEPEPVFGELDGSTYSALLTRSDDGRVRCTSFVVDGHTIALTQSSWGSREEAMAALAEMASGAQRPS